jgi:hypothetical protein
MPAIALLELPGLPDADWDAEDQPVGAAATSTACDLRG